MNNYFDYYAFIACLIIGAVYCFGVYKIFDDILISVRAKIEIVISAKWCKPLFTCPPCMGSFHGLYIGLVLFGVDWLILPYCICLCGFNYIVNSLLPQYE